MSPIAILNDGRRVQAVRLSPIDAGLLLVHADGSEELIGWWRLFRRPGDGATASVGRFDNPAWELRIASTHRALLSRVGGKVWGRVLGPLRRFGTIKLVAGLLVMLGTVAESLPASATASLVPAALERRLSSGPMLRHSADVCARPDGIRTLRNMVRRLDPVLARSVDLRVYRVPEFLVAAIPGNRLVIMKEATSATDADQLAALVAHELAHLRHGDPIVAAVRADGLLGVAGQIISGPDNPALDMNYGGHEEGRADREAIAMLRRAGIPLRPAAEMFEQMRIAKASNDGFAFEQRAFHYGAENRAAVWAAAAKAQGAVTSPFDQSANNALFNLCWSGPLPFGTGPRPPRPVPGQPGTGRIG